MAEFVPVRLKLTGDTADHHQFQGYDGYMALAGFAWTLSLVANYAETGKIRQRGDFPGRHAVRATAPAEGSVVIDFMVWLAQSPQAVFGLAGAGAASPFFYSLLQRVIARNLGDEEAVTNSLLLQLLEKRTGDVERLVAINEAPIRQAHGLIDNGAKKISIVGGQSILAQYDEESRDYVKLSIEDDHTRIQEVRVSAFSGNSGYGSVFDLNLGRNLPVSMSKEVLTKYGSVFTWGLDQYVRKTGKTITLTYNQILAMDGTPKRYIALAAQAN